MHLVDAELSLRPWRRDDLAALAVLMCDAETMEHTGGALSPGDVRELLERYVTSGERAPSREAADGIVAVYAVEIVGRVVGSADVVRLERAPGRVALEIGYLIARSDWRRGLGVRAARLILGVARALAAPGQEVLALVNHGHDASVGVLERIGLVPDGTYQDPDDGEVLVYVHRPPRAPALR